MIKFFKISFIGIFLKLVFIGYIILSYIWFFKINKFSKVKRTLYFLFAHLFVGINLLIYIHINISNSIENIKTGTFEKIPNITIIKNHEGEIIGRIGMENREYEILDNIPDKILESIICVEDASFFSNFGISFKNTFFNFFKAVFTNKKITGASTITQQLSRNLFLSKKLSIIRKIKEVYLSFYLSFYFTKEQILEMYVNYVYFGDNCYGIKSSSKHFFHKNLSELNSEEIAFLVALIKGPSYYLKNLNMAMERKDYILSRMFKNDIIDSEEYVNSKSNPVNLQNKKSLHNQATYFYVVEEVKELLKDMDLDPEDGYVVEVTIQNGLHKFATNTFKEVLDEAENKMVWKGPIGDRCEPLDKFSYLKKNNEKIVYMDADGNVWNDNNFKNKISSKDLAKYKNIIDKYGNKMVVIIRKENNEWYLKNPPKLNGGGVIIDIHTGKILSTIGGRGFDYSFINGATQVAKSPGSIAKIITTTAALEAGLTPDDELLDVPIYVNSSGDIFFINESQVEEYLHKSNIKVIKNHDRKYFGPVSLQKAVTHSRNIPMILLIKKLGIHKVKEIGIKMGIVDKQVPFYLSSTLGSIYVNLRSMASGIASIGNGGYKLEKLHLINKITDLNGTVVYEINENLVEDREKILKDNTVRYSNEIYHSVAKGGIRNRLSHINKKICCKTGTSQENKEASFVVWDKNYLIYFIIYNTDVDDNLLNNDFLYELWGSQLPLFISKNILGYLEPFLEDALYLNVKKEEEVK